MPIHPWPEHSEYIERFKVPDLSNSVAGLAPTRVIFIGESPHRDEVSPEDSSLRSPFRGVAGREWWKELFAIAGLKVEVKPVPARNVLMDLCDRLKIQVLNAVQFPIDPKIKLHFGDAASPEAYLGFAKGSGPIGYKAVFKNSKWEGPVGQAIQSLVERLNLAVHGQADQPSQPIQVVCLGNDSKWFVEQALSLVPENSVLKMKPVMVIPHPSSWWRNEMYRKRAVAALHELLGQPPAGFSKQQDEESAPWVRKGSGPLAKKPAQTLR